MKPTEHNAVQARILKYAEEIDWTFVPQKSADTHISSISYKTFG